MSEEVSEVLEETNLSEYYDTLNIYYADKLKSSLKKKFNSCPGCKGKREFIVKKDELIYSCGSNKGECGPQITIKLADYLDYEKYCKPKHYKLLKRIINDIGDMAAIQSIDEKLLSCYIARECWGINSQMLNSLRNDYIIHFR